MKSISSSNMLKYPKPHSYLFVYIHCSVLSWRKVRQKNDCHYHCCNDALHCSDGSRRGIERRAVRPDGGGRGSERSSLSRWRYEAKLLHKDCMGRIRYKTPIMFIGKSEFRKICKLCQINKNIYSRQHHAECKKKKFPKKQTNILCVIHKSEKAQSKNNTRYVCIESLLSYPFQVRELH